jgi:hypothetical protein
MERADQMVIHTSQSKYRERRTLPRYSREVIALVELRLYLVLDSMSSARRSIK